jgi:hypothetical protein
MLTRRQSRMVASVPVLLAGQAAAQAPTLNKNLAPLARILGRNTSTYAPQPKNPKGRASSASRSGDRYLRTERICPGAT